MTLSAHGIGIKVLHDDIVRRIRLICNFHKRGATSSANMEFLDMRFLLEKVVQEDVLEGQNPAMTEWRLDQFNDWLQGEFRALNSSEQKIHIPRLVLDWSTYPVTLSCLRVVAGHGPRS